MDPKKKYCILFGGVKYILYAGINTLLIDANCLIINELARI